MTPTAVVVWGFFAPGPGGPDAARDVAASIAVVEARVREVTGVRLETELHLVGFDDDTPAAGGGS